MSSHLNLLNIADNGSVPRSVWLYFSPKWLYFNAVFHLFEYRIQDKAWTVVINNRQTAY